MKSRRNKILIFLSSVGPGLFLIGYNIGTGSITTMAKAGANYGMTLFWALFLSCIFTYVLMVAYGKVTIVTGKTALNNFRENFKAGTILSAYIFIAVVTGELLAIMGVMGIVVDLLAEGLRLLGFGRVNRFTITTVLIVALYLLLWFGRYTSFEKVLTFFVTLMGICFLVVFFMLKPDFITIVKGMVPSIPRQEGSFGLVAAMVGTTCSAAVFIVRSTVVAEKGWSIKDLKTEKRDAFVSATLMLFLSGVIMAVAAGTLHVMGLTLTNTLEMIRLFEPLGGKAASLILITGIAGAGLSTVFPIILIAPWLYCDFTGKPRDIRSPLFRILGMAGIICGFGFLFIKETPPALMIFSQAFQACILPAVSIPILAVMGSKKIMGNYRAGIRMRAGLWAVVLFSIITTYFAIVELF